MTDRETPHLVYVPSKGRPKSSTLLLLRAWNIPHVMVVEPQEKELYLREIEQPPEEGGLFKIKVLEDSNQGIAYVRNKILEDARLRRAKWFWMLDDDITGFHLSESGKNIKWDPGTVLLEAQKVFRRVGMVGQGALEYAQFSWAAKKDHAIGYCDVAVCINVEATKDLSYRAEMNLKEDRDFTLQILKKGYLTVRASKCSFQAPKNGSNEGGLYDSYKQGLEEQASRRMEAAWPGVCKFQLKPDGRPDVKINWRAFKPPKSS